MRSGPVLVTRPHAQGEKTAEKLRSYGLLPLCVPLLEVENVNWQWPEIEPQAVLITSANAISALKSSPLPRDTAVFAVGDKTAQELRAAGFTKVESAAGDVYALARLVTKRCGQGLGALLYLSGDAVAGNLPGLLGNAGFWVESRIVYRAKAANSLPPEALEAKTALLYSPRSATILARLIPHKELVTLYCLSPNIAHAAGEGWARVVVARNVEEDTLLQALLMDLPHD